MNSKTNNKNKKKKKKQVAPRDLEEVVSSTNEKVRESQFFLFNSFFLSNSNEALMISEEIACFEKGASHVQRHRTKNATIVRPETSRQIYIVVNRIESRLGTMIQTVYATCM